MDEARQVTSQNGGALSTPKGETKTSVNIELRPWVVVPKPSEADVEELMRQRVACGWDWYLVQTWEEEVSNGTRYIWFIDIRTPTGLTETAGMISICLYNPSDLTLANLRAPWPRTGDRVEGSSLYVYPKYRGQGICGAAIREMERKAAELGAAIITTNTMAPSANVQIYERMGYKQYKAPEKVYNPKMAAILGQSGEHCYAVFSRRASLLLGSIGCDILLMCCA